jgi:PGDYG protein
MVLDLENPDLTADGAACWVVKDEVVRVEFALAAGVLESAVGLNRYAVGDALLTGSTGDRWCVSRDRFDVKYRPEPPTLPGQGGSYRNRPVAVLAKRMSVAFVVARSAGGDLLLGDAGDWLLQYAPGDHGVVAQARFDKVYRVVDAPGENAANPASPANTPSCGNVG